MRNTFEFLTRSIVESVGAVCALASAVSTADVPAAAAAPAAVAANRRRDSIIPLR
jgi:hypothetical protein